MKQNKLFFNAEGRFTILQVADLHAFEASEPEDERALRRAVETVRPDLIVLTGDNISGYAIPTKAGARQAIKNYMDLLDSCGVPVAAVFGNHDDDKTPYTKFEQLAQYESYGCFVGCEGFTAERSIGGRHTVHTGNYHLPVYAGADSDRVVFNLWCFDSGSDHADPAVDSYGYVFPEQVAWYVKQSNKLKEANGGVPVPSLVFQHIAPPHIVRALREVPKGTPGAVAFAGSFYTLPDGVDPETNRLREAPCPPNTDLPEGYVQLDAMLRQGDVRAVFFGHDHINSFVVPYEGVDLVCSPGCGVHAYHDEQKGFRVITLDKRDLRRYETHTIRTDALPEPRKS
jgi:predicted phosphodiesterase